MYVPQRASGTAQGIAREAWVPPGPGFATAQRSRAAGEGALSERSPKPLRGQAPTPGTGRARAGGVVSR